MGVEKQGSKGGRYVGNFLQLFDWNGKSRKKLYSNKSDFQEGSKQGKRSHINLPVTQVHTIDGDDNPVASIKGSSDYSCASSVTDEEGNGTKAPGVVARLMGLDFLPPPGVSEPSSTPYLDSRFLRDVPYRRTPDFPYELPSMQFDKLPTKLEGLSRNPSESRPQKMMNMPIERFQTEVLPPRSAKSISITHHKLLSPIKSPGFIPSKNAAQIMEDAVRIIEPGPRASSNAKMPPVGSSSTPLKIRNLKERIDAVQRPSRLSESFQKPVESKAVSYLKGQSLSKSWNGVEDVPKVRPSSSFSEESSSAGLKSKGKSISLAVQAKVNVQKREGLSSSGSCSLQAHKEHNEFKSSQPLKTQQNTQKSVQKKPSVSGSSGVLRQNNQKQNRSTCIDKLPSKGSVSNQQVRKTLSGDGSYGRNRTLNKATGNFKVGARSTVLSTNDVEKVIPSSRPMSRPLKRRSIEGGSCSETSGFLDNVLIDKDEKSIQHNVAIEAHPKLVEDSKMKGMDVISFTFTSPMKKTMAGSQSSKQVLEKHNSFSMGFNHEKVSNDTKNSSLSSLRLDEIGGDALSILLEQKLRELTYGIGSSCHGSAKSGSLTTSPSVLPSEHKAVSTTLEDEWDNRSQHGLKSDELSSIDNSSCLSTEDHMQGAEEEGDQSVNSNSETRMELSCRHPSPNSIFEPPFSNESCNSSDSGGDSSNSMDGSVQCSSVQSQQAVDSDCPKKLLSTESDMELSDSGSSIVLWNTNGGHTGFNNLVRRDKWELEYVREILCNAEAELMFKDFILGRTSKIINPNVFDQLENWKNHLGNDSEWYFESRIGRKFMFDCVCECLDLRFRPYVGGACRGRAKGELMVQRREWLAEEVYKEIRGSRNIGDWMLDGLVEKDMSRGNGKWLEFEIEEFELGAEIGKSLLNSLINEVVVDVFLGW